mgnify:CR=1 FL=1
MKQLTVLWDHPAVPHRYQLCRFAFSISMVANEDGGSAGPTMLLTLSQRRG